MNPITTYDTKNLKIIDAKNLKKSYFLDTTKIDVIRNINLQIFKGEFLILMGPSGSGKTTLLNLIGGIDRVTEGEIVYNLNSSLTIKKEENLDITTLSDPKLTSFRRKNLSYVFQFYSLIPTLSAKENVQLMAELIGYKGKKLQIQSEKWLKVVGLEERMNNFPGQLSGGERQRVAIARAIAKEPKILFCDEPTGQLDQKNGKQVVDTLLNVCKTTDTTIMMVTHDSVYKSYADRVLYLEDGNITGEDRKNDHI